MCIDRAIFQALVLTFIGALVCFLPSNLAAQEAKYWIDHNLDSCEEKDEPGSHTVMAYSPAQSTWCAWGFSSLEKARARALRECKADVPSKLRKIAPCRIVYEDGKIADKSAFKEERRDIRVPMTFEVYDGVSRTKEIKQGYIVIGKFKDFSERSISVVFRPGGVACRGAYEVKALRVNTKVKCFDEFVFIGKRIRRGGHFKDGGRFVAFFEATFEFEKSYIKAQLRRN